MTAEIKNLTPHPVHLLDESNNIIRTFMPDGLARLKANTVDAGFSIDGCRVTTTQFGIVEGLPDAHYQNTDDCFQMQSNGWGYYIEECGFCTNHLGNGICGAKTPSTYYIVSQLIKSALPKRVDLLVPAEVVRDDNGNIIGCRSLGI